MNNKADKGSRWKSAVLAGIMLCSLAMPPVMILADGEKTTVGDYISGGQGTDTLPGRIDLEENAVEAVSGALFNSIAQRRQTWIFEKKDHYSWKFDGRLLHPTEASDEYSLGITLTCGENGVQAEFDCKRLLPGLATIRLYVGNYFSNAAIASIDYVAGSCNDINKSESTAAVVDEGYITFNITHGGTYLLADSGKTVAEATVSEAKVTDEKSHDNQYTLDSYKGTNYGTAQDPLTILGDLSKLFHASWKSMNTIAGFDGGFSPTEDSYNGSKVMKTMIEYRNAATGHLNGALYIDGSEWKMTTESRKGPYYLDYMLDPPKESIEEMLLSHSLYSGKYASRMDGALKTLSTYSESDDTLLFFLRRTREFAGALHYRIDVSRYFSPGDVVNVQYVLGSSNGNLYHGEAVSNAQLLLEEPSYAKYDSRVVVDYQGYAAFTIYNGGYFTLTKEGVERPRVNEVSGSNESDPDAASTGEAEGGALGIVPENSDAVKSEENKTMPEMVPEGAQSERGFLKTPQADIPNRGKKNFKSESADGSVCVEGYIQTPNLNLGVKDLQSQIGKVQGLFDSTHEVKQLYDIFLTDAQGEHYKLKQGEFLAITIRLGKGEGPTKMDSFLMKYIQNDGTLSQEQFSSSVDADESGTLYISFNTTHLSTFAVLKKKVQALVTDTVISQEYTAETATALANQEKEKPNHTKSVVLILSGSGILLVCAVVFTERMRRKQRMA